MRLAAAAVALLGGLSALTTSSSSSAAAAVSGAVEVEAVVGPRLESSRVLPGIAVPLVGRVASGGARACPLLEALADASAGAGAAAGDGSPFRLHPLPPLRVVVVEGDLGPASAGPSATCSTYVATTPASLASLSATSSSAFAWELARLLAAHGATLLACSGDDHPGYFSTSTTSSSSSSPGSGLRAALEASGVALLTGLGPRRAAALAKLAGGAPLVPGGAALRSLRPRPGSEGCGGGGGACHVGRHGLVAAGLENIFIKARENNYL